MADLAPGEEPQHSGLKRCFDFTGAGFLLLILVPLFLIVSLLIVLLQGFPVFFRQARGGLLGTPFDLVKFRTMRESFLPDGSPKPDAERLTWIGRLLRATGLDELPELWNVLKGDMSLVGPRPLLARYLDRYTPEQARRHLVRPGLTGWAQVHGRNALSWEEKFRLDVWYVDHRSFWLDVKILFLTVGLLFSGRGVSSGTHATMEEFRGSGAPAVPNRDSLPKP